MFCNTFQIAGNIIVNAQQNAFNEHSLLLFFAKNDKEQMIKHFSMLKEAFPQSIILGCSSGNQIYKDEISQDKTTVSALSFDSTLIKLQSEKIVNHTNSFACGQALARKLNDVSLKGILVLSDGLQVNGSELISGLRNILPKEIAITGGLAADDALFEATYVAANCPPETGIVAAVGFYGNEIDIGFSNGGGWSDFGPKRTITKASSNVLAELDGKPALDLYEKYLGEEAEGLPGTALLFPLKIYDPNNKEHSVVRTVLAVDKVNRTMTFAGDMPQGWQCQLMRGTHENLINSAKNAAEQLKYSPQFALLISCIGRKLLMGQKTIEEVMTIKTILGDEVPLAGFYSYGEISPHFVTGVSDLHNQTMTIMTLSEREAA